MATGLCRLGAILQIQAPTMKVQVSEDINDNSILFDEIPFLGGATIDLVINEINYNSSEPI